VISFQIRLITLINPIRNMNLKKVSIRSVVDNANRGNENGCIEKKIIKNLLSFLCG